MSLHPYAPLEPFAGSFETADGFPMLVGGLCPPGQGEKSLCMLAALSSTAFGPYHDGLAIDVRLCRILRQIAPPGIRFLAASICVAQAASPCGGIAGDIFSEPQSSDGSFSWIADGIFGFALPGVGAALILGSELQSRRFYETAISFLNLSGLTKKRTEDFLKSVSVYPIQFLFVTDGSGGSTGCMCARSDERSVTLWLPPFDGKYD